MQKTSRMDSNRSTMIKIEKYLDIFRITLKMTAQTFKEINHPEHELLEAIFYSRKVQGGSSRVTSSGDETSSGIVSDEEIDKQKLGAHYSYMEKIQEVSPEESSSTSQPLEQKDDSNVIPDSSNICTNDNQVDQNAAECVDERAALANLIANLTLDTEENKTILKQLKKANASLTQELKECKTNLDESSRALGEATSSRDSSLIALQTKQTELEKYTTLNDLTSDYKILQTKLNETLGLLALKDIDIKEGLKLKPIENFSCQSENNVKEGKDIDTFCPNGEETVTLEKESRSKLDKDKVKPYDYTYQNSLYETFKPPSKTYLDQLERAKEVRKTMWRKTSAFPNPTAKTMEVLIKTLLMPLSNKTILDSHCFVHELKREMNDDLEYVKSLEKEIDELESEKADFSNIYDLLLEECVSKDVTCSYLHSLSDLNANTELQCLYLHKVKECECLAQKLSKQTESVNNEVHK
ncbi:hypothetical protein Tco_0020584 [Tanacetum coccineum]